MRQPCLPAVRGPITRQQTTAASNSGPNPARKKARNAHYRFVLRSDSHWPHIDGVLGAVDAPGRARLRWRHRLDAGAVGDPRPAVAGGPRGTEHDARLAP